MVARVGHGGGLNCTLKYLRDGKWRAYRLRCTNVTHGLSMVATEGHARTTRAFYPHKRTPAQFMLTFALLGRQVPGRRVSEYEMFNSWMKQYMDYLLDLDATGLGRGMQIDVPVRNFHRHGIPLGPLTFGEHVGSMVWMQTITFETTYEPGDVKVPFSKLDHGSTSKDRNARYFYPEGVQLSGNQRPTTYDTVVLAPQGNDLLTPASVQAAVVGPDSAPPRPPRESLPGGRGGV